MSQQPLSDLELSRYARQILLDGWDIEAQTRLKNACILIIGMGGLGCPVAETLVRSGVGHVHIVDDDVIDDSNLQRQTLFTPSDIGKSKAITAQHRLSAINDLVTIISYQQRFEEHQANGLIQVIHDYLQKNTLKKLNLILDCTDNFKTRDFINKISVKYNIPLLSASAIAQEGQLALFEPQQQSGCYHCIFQFDPETSNELTERRCIHTGVLSSTTAIMGNLQAQTALSFLGLDHNPLSKTLLLWQGHTLSIRKLQYQPDPNCTVCGRL